MIRGRLVGVLTRRGVLTDDIEHVSGGQTFFWKGVYGWDLNERETLDTQLNVFADSPRSSRRSRKGADVLFLANIQPDLQRQVRAQCTRARFVALDSMNLWIEIARDSLVAAISEVDCLILNDAEVRQLTAEPNLCAPPEDPRWGPRVLVAKQGEYGAAMVTEEGFFALPAYPLETVVDPTGAGDTFAGGFLGYVAAHPTEPLDHELLAARWPMAPRSPRSPSRSSDRARRAAHHASEIAERVVGPRSNHAAGREAARPAGLLNGAGRGRSGGGGESTKTCQAPGRRRGLVRWCG